MASASIGEARIKVNVIPSLGDYRVMITLTHATDIDGRFQPLDSYTGRTVLDALRIEAIEEVVHPTKGTVSYVTMQSGQAHTVTETPEQIDESISRALRLAFGQAGVGQEH